MATKKSSGEVEQRLNAVREGADELDLSGLLKARDFPLVAKSLASSPALRTLDLSENNLGDAGLRTLLPGLAALSDK